MLPLATGTTVRGIVASPPRASGSSLFFLDLRDAEVTTLAPGTAAPAPVSAPAPAPAPSASPSLQLLHFIFSSDHFHKLSRLRQLRRDTRKNDIMTITIAASETSRHGQALHHVSEASINAMFHVSSTGTGGEFIRCDPESSDDSDDTDDADKIDADEDESPGLCGVDENVAGGETHPVSSADRFSIFAEWLSSTFSLGDSQAQRSQKRQQVRQQCQQKIRQQGQEREEEEEEIRETYSAGRLPEAPLACADCSGGSKKRTIYDVGGGRGELALALTLLGHAVTLIDPRENAGRLSARQRKAWRRSGAPPFAVRREHFRGSDPAYAKMLLSETETETETEKAVAAAAGGKAASFGSGTPLPPPLVVGLHPDEAVDDIVAFAVAHRWPFAVVPCCVFARIKQHRRLLRRRKGGGDEREAAGTERRRRTTAVRTHEELCEYLMQRGGRGTKRSDLGFSGRPTVIYHLGNYDDYDEPAVQPAFAFLSAGLQRASKCTKRT